MLAKNEIEKHSKPKKVLEETKKVSKQKTFGIKQQIGQEI